MPGCILRVSGEDFQVDAFLANSDLRPYRVYHRGELGRHARLFTKSGFNVDVSFPGGVLETQLADAIRFLSSYEAELQRLNEFPGVTDSRLDFGYARRDVAAQYDYLPPDLLYRAGKLGIGIELSQYATSSSESTAH